MRVLFTVNGTSAFSDGVDKVLQEAGVRLIPWRSICDGEAPYDLALSASENVDFERLSAHTIVLPHGLGFNKFVPDSNGDGIRLAGLPPESVLRDGGATVVLSHPAQRRQIAAASKFAANLTEVVGDPTLARLLSSRNLRSRYREAFGTGNRTLVVLASTWRPDSLLGKWHSLPAGLLAELPLDQYQVLAAIHPNVWSFYGAAQLSWWLSSALDAGLILLPPHSGWQAALIAADQVITDHGSLGLFAAALDKPILHVGPSAETVPGTAPALLLREATVISPSASLREQVEECLGNHRSGRFDHITNTVFAHTPRADTNLRDLVYRKLDLAPTSATVSPRRFPLHEQRGRRITSWLTENATLDGEVLRLTRFPAPVSLGDRAAESHLIVDETEPAMKIVERAAAVIRDSPIEPSAARQWANSVLETYPGARIALASTLHGGLAVLRDGTVVHIETVKDSWDPALAASAVYCCRLSGDLHDRRVTLQAGPVSSVIQLRIG